MKLPTPIDIQPLSQVKQQTIGTETQRGMLARSDDNKRCASSPDAANRRDRRVVRFVYKSLLLALTEAKSRRENSAVSSVCPPETKRVFPHH